MLLTHLLQLLSLLLPTFAALQELNWTLSYKQVNPDNKSPCQIISINNQFPAPIIRLQKGDTLRINLHNSLHEDTALHFHGIFQNGSNQMDGPTMLTQCPIPPDSDFKYEFTVNQTGTYWYHAHESVQYGDGLRGALIIEDDEEEKKQIGYDEDVVITLSDWYYGNSASLLKESKGDEPKIDSSLFNDTVETKWEIQPNKKYLIRLINMGMSASQYFYIEDHNLTIVEVDGVKVDPIEADSVMLATGQRYGVLLQTKSSTDKNYGMVSVTNMMMRKVFLDNWLVYDSSKPLDPPQQINPKHLNYPDDMDFRPLVKIPKLRDPHHQLEFTYSDLEYQGQNYWTMNGIPHLSPKIPTLMTLISSNGSTYSNPIIYGNSTNVIIIQHNEIVELVINSNDMMKHPFHLHGHNFQVMARGRREHYNHDSSKFPEYPMIRDTVVVPNHGYVVLRFIADNPGVWFFHCHTDWHAATGLGIVFIEAPELIRENTVLSEDNLKVCKEKGIKIRGNAAGNDEDFLDMDGDVSIYNVQEEKPKESVLMSTTITPTTTASQSVTSTSSTSPSSTSEMTMPKIPFNTKLKVLVVYATIMLSIAVIGAIIINYKIRSNIHYKKGKQRRSSTIANYEPVEQGIEI